MTAVERETSIFSTWSELYRVNDWPGSIPLPPRRKKFPPTGLTGREGRWPSEDDLQEWAGGTFTTADRKTGAVTRHRVGNIGLRAQRGVSGIDVDQYGDKCGADELTALEDELGPLPATWRSSARPWPSGIRWYRIPEDVELKGAPASGIEVVQFHHRYAVAPPSIHPDTGEEYRWYRPDGEVSTTPPRPDELPELPAAWVERWRSSAKVAEKRDPVPPRLAPPSDRRSAAVQKVLNERKAWTPGGRHDQALALSMALARLEHSGHPGATEALKELGEDFIRNKPEAEDTEWDDLLTSARQKAASTASTRPDYEDAVAEARARRAAENARLLKGPDVRIDEHGNVAEDQPSGTRSPEPEEPGEDGPDQDDSELTTWEPVDLGPVLAGGVEPILPTIGVIENGLPIFYEGRINGLFGESGSGKTWVADATAAQVLSAGHGVMYVDLEDDAGGIVSRLLALGADPDAIAERFLYVHPDLPLRVEVFELLAQAIAERDVRLVVLDSLGEVMSLEGVEDKDGPVTAFMQRFPRWLARLGPAVVPIDHVPKAKDAPLDYAIGSQRKRGAVTGALYRVDQFAKMAQGRTGAVKLTVAKDRLGTRPKGSVAAEITFDATEPDRMVATFEAPSSVDDSGQFRPTTLMARVSRWLEANEGRHTQNALLGAVQGNRDGKRAALALLVEEGFVSMESEGQAHLYGFIKRFK